MLGYMDYYYYFFYYSINVTVPFVTDFLSSSLHSDFECNSFGKKKTAYPIKLKWNFTDSII